MAIEIPSIDNRRYQQLLEESLARIPVHTPEWTNFNDSDPGVTLIQVFAFLTESLLYRANQIPDRNRRKFLQLLRLPLQGGSPARGLVTITNDRGPIETITLGRDLEVRAGQVPFRTLNGLDVLPVEAQVCFKHRLADPPEEQKTYYRQLYASFLGDESGANPLADIEVYERVPLETRGAAGVDILDETVDQSLWVSLLARPKVTRQAARDAIGGKVLTLGIVPITTTDDAKRRLAAVNTETTAANLIKVQAPDIRAGLTLAAREAPRYRTLATFSMPIEPGIIEVPLGPAAQIDLWQDIDPLESGADNFPPSLEDPEANERVITWLRLVWPAGAASRLYWLGINACQIEQRTRVSNDLLSDATGEPDQAITLAHPSIIPGSLKLFVTPPGSETTTWKQIDDLFAAGPEVPGPDPRLPPGTVVSNRLPSQVYSLDAEAGVLRFGNGARGARPPSGATLRVSYDFSVGRAGNVGEKTLTQAPALPSGLQVNNPVRTWGGTDAESTAQGEKQITQYLQHRDRLVTLSDFEVIARRTPGVDVGRVEVLPAYNPSLVRQEAGNAPGAVTLMLIPKFSATRPNAPSPDPTFLSAVCAWLDPRRLVTTELFLQGPHYISVWISVAIEITPTSAADGSQVSTAVVREAVKKRLREFLAPVRPDGNGWPLRRPVLRLELMAETSRVDGVALVNQLLLATGNGADADSISLVGLDLPRIDGIEVVIGPNALAIDQLRGSPAQPTSTRKIVPVPAIPAEC